MLGDSDLINQLFIFSFVTLIIALIFILLLIYSFYRLKIYKLSSKNVFFGKFLYTQILIICGVQGFLSIMLTAQGIRSINKGKVEVTDKYILNFIVIGDLIFFIIYYIFSWQQFLIQKNAHIKLGNIITANRSCSPDAPQLKKVFALLLGLQYAVGGVIFLIYNLPSNNPDSAQQKNSDSTDTRITNYALAQFDVSITLLIPMYYLVTSLWFYCHYRGKPFRSKKQMMKISYSNKVLGFLALCRLAQAIILQIISQNINNILDFLKNPAKTTINQILRMFIPFVIIIIIQVIPLLIIHNITTVNLFTNESEAENDASQVLIS